MAAEQNAGQHPLGVTSGSPQRPAQQLEGPLLTFDLAAELDRLRQEPGYQRGDHGANTLVHEADCRVVLVALKAGARIREHDAAARITVQTITGRVRLRVRDQAVELPTGHLLVLAPNLAHDVEALEESAFLLTFAWVQGR